MTTEGHVYVLIYIYIYISIYIYIISSVFIPLCIKCIIYHANEQYLWRLVLNVLNTCMSPAECTAILYYLQLSNIYVSQLTGNAALDEKKALFAAGATALVLSLLALLVQKYKYWHLRSRRTLKRSGKWSWMRLQKRKIWLSMRSCIWSALWKKRGRKSLRKWLTR